MVESQVVEVTRAVSIRDFVRSPGSLMAEVEKNGAIIALARSGRIVALLTPLPERFIVGFDCPPVREPSGIEDDEGEVVFLPDQLRDRSDIVASILVDALERHPMPLPEPRLADRGNKALLHALYHLEIGGFIERRWAGDFLTPKGLSAARAMKRLLDRAQRPAPS